MMRRMRYLCDYIYVLGLFVAYGLAIQELFHYNKSMQLNFSNGQGFSVQQVIIEYAYQREKKVLYGS